MLTLPPWWVNLPLPPGLCRPVPRRPRHPDRRHLRARIHALIRLPGHRLRRHIPPGCGAFLLRRRPQAAPAGPPDESRLHPFAVLARIRGTRRRRLPARRLPRPGERPARLRRDRELHLVQCKNWRSRRVGVRVVREVYGVLAAERAQHAANVCSGDFTGDARRFAAGKPVRLVNANALLALVRGVQRTDDGMPSSPDDDLQNDPAAARTLCLLRDNQRSELFSP